MVEKKTRVRRTVSQRIEELNQRIAVHEDKINALKSAKSNLIEEEKRKAHDVLSQLDNAG